MNFIKSDSRSIEGARKKTTEKRKRGQTMIIRKVYPEICFGLRGEGYQTMNKHNLFYYSYASFTHAQLWLLKMAAFYFEKLYLLDPVSENWATIGTDHDACRAVRQLHDVGILQKVIPEEGVAKRTGPISIHRDLQEISNYE